MNDSFELFQQGQRLLQAGRNSDACVFFLQTARRWRELALESNNREEQKIWLDRAKKAHRLADRLAGEKEADNESLPSTSPPRLDSRHLRSADFAQTSSDPDAASPWELNDRPKLRFSDIAGLDEVKSLLLRRVILPFRNRTLASTYQRGTGMGFLMFGPPGTGKTMMARAIAGELGFPFLKVQSSSVMSKWVGSTEQNFRDLFDTARKKAPAILFFDEAEALLGTREKDQSEVMGRAMSELLTQIDGVDTASDNLVLAAASNRPWDIDPAMKRPGRFGEHFYIPLPDLPAREFILRKKLEKIPGADQIDFAGLVERTERFSGADLNGLIDRILDPAFERAVEAGHAVPITEADVQNALSQSRPTITTEELARFEEYRKTGQ